MSAIKSFEDLQVWQKTRELVKSIYKITSNFPKDEKFNIIDQLRRAIISVLSNIAEGFSRYYSAETVMFYRNARGSLSEVKSLLYVCLDIVYIDKKICDELFAKIDEIGKMLNGLIKSTKFIRKAKL
ncbi:hypothetical protein A2V80_01105 [Candidatus Woesebacteria bacterium RBG_16_39_8b]|uniref:Four helix bundle protein n=1 Tax=Candidatus Woesebacteria bacterium RBG_16_39_8b TaxID=1802482 RepID=A0A1F7XFS0_9BACT|nr:MAG: hypothetical protein A2V80_01105 [Candidatus Woesebacteria bacterium RBG_16_39_8b]